MIMYKLLPTDIQTNKPANCVIRTTDGACIPMSNDNTDFLEYQKWLAAGNTPIPAENT